MKDLELKTLESCLIPCIRIESDQQIEKWGIQDQHPFEWMTIITEEVGEMAKAMLEHEWGNGSPREVTMEAIQVATLCLKIAEMYGAISSHGICAEKTL